MTARLARQALVSLECEVSPATSIALALFLAHKALPDLILSENMMTDGNGLDFLREVKSDWELKSIPFVLMDESHDNILKEAGLSAGADRIIIRPGLAAEFLQIVKPFLRKRKQWRPEESPE